MCRMEKFPGHGLCPDLSGPGRPARSMHIPARRQILGRTLIPRHFLFENRSLVDITERKWRPWGALDENCCFTESNAFCVATAMALEAISYLKINHWSIFKEEMRNENSARPRCDFIYTKNSARPGSGFLSTQRIGGGDLEENGNFSLSKMRFWGIYPSGGDLEENGHFP